MTQTKKPPSMANQSLYVFPDIGGRTITYLGRRFMAVELTAEDPWERTDGGSPEITSKQFDYLLLDGKHAAEFAGLKRLDDGSLLGSLLDIGGGTVFSSIREAITGLAKESAAYEKSLGFEKNFRMYGFWCSFRHGVSGQGGGDGYQRTNSDRQSN